MASFDYPKHKQKKILKFKKLKTSFWNSKFILSQNES
jgi:hypothetical protein